MLIFIALLGANHAGAQEHPVQFSARVAPTSTAAQPVLVAGQAAAVALSATIQDGWHIYSPSQGPGGPSRMSVSVSPISVASMSGPIVAPKPTIAFDSSFGINTETLDGTVAFQLPLTISPTVAGGARRLAIAVGYQTCTAHVCLPPRTDTVAVMLSIAPNANASATTSQSSGSGGDSASLFFLLAATMGALSLLTPCVFPMVPVTMSYFGSRGGSRAGAGRDAAVFGLGIVGTFTGVGLLTSIVFGVANVNRVAANPWLNAIIALAFVVFAMSLFDKTSLGIPGALLTRVDALSRAKGGVRDGATLAMGATFALTSFTCTAPFVGTLLVSATQGSWKWPAAGLLVFSTVFAIPFVLIALIPSMAESLPKSGDWLASLKGALAFVELAAAVKFLANVDMVEGWGIITRSVVLAIWVVLGVLAIAYLLGLLLPSVGGSKRSARPAAALVATGATAWLAMGLVAHRSLGEIEPFLPPPAAASVSTEVDGLPWLRDDYAAALARARVEHKLVLIDFTGYTCTNCRWMETNMFPRADVRAALDAFVRVRLFTDGRNDRDMEQGRFQQETFGTSALPLYAIVDGYGTEQRRFLGMTRNTSTFVRFLSGPAPSL